MPKEAIGVADQDRSGVTKETEFVSNASPLLLLLVVGS